MLSEGRTLKHYSSKKEKWSLRSSFALAIQLGLIPSEVYISIFPMNIVPNVDPIFQELPKSGPSSQIGNIADTRNTFRN